MLRNMLHYLFNIFIESTDDKIDEQIISQSYFQLKSKEFTILHG